MSDIKICGFTGNACRIEYCEMWDETYKMCSMKVIGRAMMWVGDIDWLAYNKPIIDLEIEE